MQEKVQQALEEARKSLEKARINGTYRYRGEDMNADVREKVERAMEKARDAMEKVHKDMDRPIVKRSVIKTS